MQGRSLIETASPQPFEAFKELVLSEMVKFWDDKKDVQISIGETLSHFSRRGDLIGWVRSDQQANTGMLVDEIAGLSKENAHLRSQLSDKKQSVLMNGLTFEEIKMMLEGKKLWGIIKDNRGKFIGPFSVHNNDKRDAYNEMYRLGLFIHHDISRYTLSDSGRTFFNLLEEEVRERNA